MSVFSSILPGWNLSRPTSDFYKVNTSTPPFMEEVLELIHFSARYTSKVVGESCPGTFFFSLLTEKGERMTSQLERDERSPNPAAHTAPKLQ